MPKSEHNQTSCPAAHVQRSAEAGACTGGLTWACLCPCHQNELSTQGLARGLGCSQQGIKGRLLQRRHCRQAGARTCTLFRSGSKCFAQEATTPQDLAKYYKGLASHHVAPSGGAHLCPVSASRRLQTAAASSLPPPRPSHSAHWPHNCLVLQQQRQQKGCCTAG